MEIPRAPNGWTVVTPSVNMTALCNTRETPSFHPANVRSSDYHMASPYPVHSHIRSSTPSDIRLSPIPNLVKSASSLDSLRYGGYNSRPPPSYRNPPPPLSKAGPPLDVGLRDGGSESRLKEGFRLPPIQAPDYNSSGPSPYSLPPISSMEDARSITPQDSAAVLRRLRLEDDGYPKAARPSEDRTWTRRHSLSTSSSYVFSLKVSVIIIIIIILHWLFPPTANP